MWVIYLWLGVYLCVVLCCGSVGLCLCYCCRFCRCLCLSVVVSVSLLFGVSSVCVSLCCDIVRDCVVVRVSVMFCRSFLFAIRFVSGVFVFLLFSL
jgi:hypothetical protein